MFNTKSCGAQNSIVPIEFTGQIAPDLDQVQVGFPYVLPLLSQRLASSRPPAAPDGGVRPEAGG